MLRLIRRSLWWLVMLALPLQAMAGTIGLHCGGMHGRMNGAPAAVDVSHRHDGGVPSSAHAPPAAVGDAAATHHHGGHADAQPDHGDQKARGSCSACAACCAVVGLPASRPHWASHDFAQPLPTVAAAERFSFLTTGPDRPPRTSTR